MKDEKFEKIDNTKYIDLEMKSELETSFISYAMAVNISRAIPDLRDGLKPVHRRVLYAMSELGVYSNKPHVKSTRIIGEVMGKYHPHGDSAIYDTLVRMAQDFSINAPLVDGHGNFGSVDGDGAAASRYTEARMTKISDELLRDIDKDTVDFCPNFDGTLMQPTVLPSRFPNLLVNGSDGIAVGMATNIPPHNLTECIDAVLALIDNPEITFEELMDIIPAPDFPTGGLVMGRSAIRQAYKTGKGGVVIRAKAEIEDMRDGKRQRIIITEIPYQVNKSKLVMQIANLVKDKRIEGVSDLRDESSREGMRIVIELKKDSNAQIVLNQLYKATQLQTSNSIILLSLVNGVPKILPLRDILVEYLAYQQQVIQRRTRYDLNKAQEKAHILDGLMIAVKDIDEVIRIIKASVDRAAALSALVERYGFSDKQVVAILDMRLSKLTGLEVEKLQSDLAELHNAIERYTQILSSPTEILNIVKDEMTEIRDKYARPRRSELSMDYDDIDIGDLIERHDVVLSLTRQGYIKRMALAEYKSQNRGGRGVSAHKTKDEDQVIDIILSNSHSDLLFFTDKGKVYELKAYLVPEASKQAKGRAMVNLLSLATDEKVNAVLPISDRVDGTLLMATANGLVKKTKISEFGNIRKNGKIAIKLSEGDSLIGVAATSGDDEILIASDNGKCVRMHEKDIRIVGRSSIGVRSMRIGEDEKIIDMMIVNPDQEILTVTAGGLAKRSNIDDYRVQSRGGKGVKAGTFNDKTGKVIAIKAITINDDILAMADNGVVIRLHAEQIRQTSRTSQGVRIMRVGEAEVVSVAVVPRDDEQQTDDIIDNE